MPFDLSNAADLESFLRDSAADQPRVVMDLTETKYLDSTVLAILIRLHREWGTRMRVVVPENGRVSRIFEVTGIDTLLSVYRSVKDAAATAA